MLLLIIIGLVAIFFGFRRIKNSQFRGYYKCLGCGEEKHWVGRSYYDDGEVSNYGVFGYDCNCLVHDFAHIGELVLEGVIMTILGLLAILVIAIFLLIVLPALLWWPS